MEDVLTLLGDLFTYIPTSNLKNNPSKRYPTRPIFKTSLSFTHPSFISFDANWYIGENPHKHFCPLDGLDFTFNGRLGGCELIGCESD